jgi:hypothetical protein
LHSGDFRNCFGPKVIDIAPLHLRGGHWS